MAVAETVLGRVPLVLLAQLGFTGHHALVYPRGLVVKTQIRGFIESAVLQLQLGPHAPLALTAQAIATP